MLSLSAAMLAHAETDVIAVGGLHLMSLTNTLMESTNTALSRANSYGVEGTRSVGKKGKLFWGVRANYLTGGASTGVVTVAYKQMSFYGLGGLGFGSKKIRLRVSAGAGYELKNTMTFTGSGATDADYSGKGLSFLGSAQAMYLLGGKGRFGAVAEANYVYSVNRVYLNVPYTSADLDGNSSGIDLRGGLVFRF